jgi:ubiquinone/menaquinone biosynthesis C-methylase UbiE
VGWQSQPAHSGNFAKKAMKESEKRYYNQSVIWKKDLFLDPIEKERVLNINEMIPKDVETVLDAGCGNGVIINNLPKIFKKTAGLDMSEESLKYVKAEKILASITSIPFADNSFDLLICSEVLEHLKDEDYFATVKELQRVAKKYIILTFPNGENLKRSSVLCSNCDNWFHPYYHARSFNTEKAKKIFTDFNLREHRKVGRGQVYVPDFLVPLLFRLRRPRALSTSICPFCGYQDSAAEKPDVAGRFSGVKGFSPRKKRWLLALYIRK